jgi:hypothetical protein
VKWVFDSESGHYLSGTEDMGCGVWQEKNGWTGNVCIGFDVHNIGYCSSYEEAVEICEEYIEKMENN